MKNEKVALVIFAYIIGFTTAFIAFALNYDGKSKHDFAVSKTDYKEVAHADEVQTNSGVEILNKSEGLFIAMNGSERVLSAAATDDMSGEGFHTEIFTSSVSPEGKYVYFCASLVGEAGMCTNFVYSVADDIVYKIKVDGESLKLGNDEAAEVSWVKEDTLRFQEGLAAAAASWNIR